MKKKKVPAVIEVSDQGLAPKLDPSFREYASYVNQLSTQVGSCTNSSGKNQYIGKSPYAIFRKKTLERSPEIVNQSRRIELSDF